MTARPTPETDELRQVVATLTQWLDSNRDAAQQLLDAAQQVLARANDASDQLAGHLQSGEAMLGSVRSASTSAADAITEAAGRSHQVAVRIEGMVGRTSDAAAKAVADARNEMLSLTSQTASEAAEELTTRIGGITDDFAATTQGITAGLSTDVDRTSDRLSLAVQGAVERMEQAAEATHQAGGIAANRFSQTATKSVASIVESSGRISGELADALSRIDQSIDAAGQSLTSGVADQVTAVRATVSSVTSRLDTIADRNEDLARQFTAELEASGQRVRDDVDVVVRAGTEQIGAASLDSAVRIEQVAASVEQVVDAVVTRSAQAFDRASERLDGSVDQRLTTFGQQLQGTADSVSDAVGVSLAGMTGTVSEVGRRLISAGEQVEAAATIAATQMDQRGEAVVDRLLTATTSALTDMGDRLNRLTDEAGGETSAQVARLAATGEGLADQIVAATDSLAHIGDGLRAAAAQVGAGAVQATRSATDLAEATARFSTDADATIQRVVAQSDVVTAQLSDAMDTAVRHANDVIGRNTDTLTTSVAWATRAVEDAVSGAGQELTLLRDASELAMAQMDGRAHAAQSGMVRLLSDLRAQLADQVSAGVAPLEAQMAREAKQHEALAATVAAVQESLAERTLLLQRREESAARMEQVVTDAAEMVAAANRNLREEQDLANDVSRQVATQLGGTAQRAEQLLHDLSLVADRVEATINAADAGRQSLDAAVQRADLMRQAAEDLARNIRLRGEVPPPPIPPSMPPPAY